MEDSGEGERERVCCVCVCVSVAVCVHDRVRERLDVMRYDVPPPDTCPPFAVPPLFTHTHPPFPPCVPSTPTSDHLVRLGLPPVARVITSPLLRCAQTAAAAMTTLAPPPTEDTRAETEERGAEGGAEGEGKGKAKRRVMPYVTPSVLQVSTTRSLRVTPYVLQVSDSLSETCCEEWYRSWCLLHGLSDATWGGPSDGPGSCGTSKR